MGDGRCDHDVDYGDLRHRTRAEPARRIGRLWRFPADIERPGSVSGWVRCGQVIGGFAFVDGRHGYYFFEDRLVITLR